MKICFFGSKYFFDYFQIGGFESFIRRLATGLSSSGNIIDYVLSDSPSGESFEVAPNLTIRYFPGFNEASASLLTGNYDHIFKVCLSRHDRLKYLFLIGKAGKKTRWHNFFLAWPNSWGKLSLALFEGWCHSGFGRAICVSPRQYLTFKKLLKNSCHIFPPVPGEYFIRPEDKPRNSKIKVTFLGNLTKDKYIEEIITLFYNLQKDTKFQFSIYGTHDPLNKHSVSIHERLQTQSVIKYHSINRGSFSPQIEELVRNVLFETDVFIQPYRTLVNTLDMPLLLLEAMASLCAVLTTPVGSVPDIYGNSNFVISQTEFPNRAEKLLRDLSYGQIIAERERIYQRNQQYHFDTGSITDRMMSLINA